MEVGGELLQFYTDLEPYTTSLGCADLLIACSDEHSS